MGSVSQAYLESKTVKETKCLISELCRQFYKLGWVSGTGGSITMKVHDSCIPKPQQLVLMSPSGAEGGDIEDGVISSQGKMQIKIGQSKMKKNRGRRHKSDCLCAICVLKRRKRERETNARMAKGLSGVQDLQQESP